MRVSEGKQGQIMTGCGAMQECDNLFSQFDATNLHATDESPARLSHGLTQIKHGSKPKIQNVFFGVDLLQSVLHRLKNFASCADFIRCYAASSDCSVFLRLSRAVFSPCSIRGQNGFLTFSVTSTNIPSRAHRTDTPFAPWPAPRRSRSARPRNPINVPGSAASRLSPWWQRSASNP
jgi:hypothetical protein